MTQLPNTIPLLQQIVDRVNIGIFVVDKNSNVTLWNSFMESHSGIKASALVGKNLYENFPELPRAWLEQKIANVFLIKNFSFTSWEHRPYLFQFRHNRPITGDSDNMKQNCTFLPVKGESEDVEHVCVIVYDATDISIYESMLKEAVKSLAEASNKDGLTDTYNRRYLEHVFAAEFNRAQRYDSAFSVMIVDLDHFKNVNDSFGHLTGDEVLREAARRFTAAVRSSDILGRYGGEEFAIVLPETDIEGAKILAERLRQALAERPICYQGNDIAVTASIGVSEYSRDLVDYQALIDRADSALYRSKESGRNCVTVGEAPSQSPPEKEQTSINNVNYVTVGHK